MTLRAFGALSVVACSASLVACTTPQPDESSPYSIRVRIDNESDEVLPSNLRYAVVWATTRAEKGYATTADGPIADATQSLPVTLMLPDVATRLAATPVEYTSITSTVSARSYRPRIVIYGDQDGDGHFNPSVLGGTGPDTIVAVDDEFSASITALLDLKGMLALLTPSETEAFYATTDDRYTPFVWTLDSGSFRVIVARQKELTIHVSNGVFPAIDLDCYRQKSGPLLGSNSTTSSTRAIVDASLDAAAICGATITDCRSEDLATLSPPSLETNAFGNPVRIPQCRSNDLFEFLLIAEANKTCLNCACSTDIVLTLYATSSQVRPAWWPCGSHIPYCKSTLPAYTLDTGCLSRRIDAGAPDAATVMKDGGPG